MAEILEYKCPCCGGALPFDSESQKLKCPYCDTEFDAESLQGYDEVLQQDEPDDINWNINQDYSNAEFTEEDVRSYVCSSCGGEIITNTDTVATNCPYCGNPVIVTPLLSGNLKPDIVIPFRLDADMAKASLKKHLEKKILLPKVFKAQNHIDEVKGIYVPFWIYDAEADGSARFKATKVRSWTTKTRVYTETKYFSVLRSGSASFANVPVDASSRIENNLTESLEPYNMEEAIDFGTAYLSGYMAEKYDVKAEDTQGRVNERLKTSMEDLLRSTVNGFSSVVTEHSSVKVGNGALKYALLPVWILNTTWNKRKFLFAMNGQTGKFVGDLPIDKGKLWLFRLLWFLVVGGIAFGLLTLYWLYSRGYIGGGM